MEEQLIRDKEERFGKKFKVVGGEAVPVNDEKKPIDKVKIALKTIRELYPEDRHPDVASNCIKMLKAYLTNLSKDPTNDKFRKINKENKFFKERVAEVQGGTLFLKAVGFVDRATTMEAGSVDPTLLKESLALLE